MCIYIYIHTYWLIFSIFRKNKQTNAIALLFLFLHLHFFPDMFFIFSHKFAKKNAATPFFFEFWKVFVYVLTFSFIFAETCCKKKKAATFFDPWLMFSARIFRNVFFIFPHTCCKTTWLHHFSQVFFCLFCPFIVSISAETCCKKKRGYTFVGSNDKNCPAFYVLGHPWLIPHK